jgi:hypothetical protein
MLKQRLKQNPLTIFPGGVRMKRLLLALTALLFMTTGAQAVVSTEYIIDDFATTGIPVVTAGTFVSTSLGWYLGQASNSGVVENSVPDIWGGIRQSVATLEGSSSSVVGLIRNSDRMYFNSPYGSGSFNVSYFGGPSNFSAASSFTLELRALMAFPDNSQVWMQVANGDGPVTLYSAHHQISWTDTDPIFETFLFSEFAGADFSDITRITWGFSAPVGPYSNISFDSLTADAAPTPIPGAIWLLGSGLAGLIGLRRKRSC